MTETKKWRVEYDHKDGRSGVVEVTTEVFDSSAFQYGNGKAGRMMSEGQKQVYDLRYNHGDLHKVMLNDWFGEGLIKATEI